MAGTKEAKPKVRKGARRAKPCKVHEPKIRRLADDWRAEAEAYFRGLKAPEVPEGYRH